VRTSLDIDKKLIVKKIVKKKCSQDARECNETQLCKMGVVLSSGKKVWNTLLGGVKYSKEAKKRGFSCGVKTKTIVKIDTADKKSCLKEPKLCNATDLCLIASTSTSTWSQNSTLKHYVTEAKKRGLSCGVKVFLKSTKKSVTKKKCSKDAKSCADTKLCSIATVYRNGIKKWNYNHYGAHINEAKRRGLYCGVNNNQKNQIKNASFSKSDFSKLNTIRKKQLQYGLKQLGFYRKSIDGLYGAGTEKAVRLYARSRGIKSGFPYSVYNKIITEVIIPSSFTIATKPKPKPKPKSKVETKSGCRSILSILTGIDELCIDRPYNPSSSGLSVDWPKDPSPYIGTSNSCISDVNCDYGYVCIKRVGRGGQCMKKPRNTNRNFEPKSCTLNTQCGIGNKCDRTYRVCVER